jgi:hypothetical protein
VKSEGEAPIIPTRYTESNKAIESAKTTAALDVLLRAMNYILDSSKAGDFATVHERLTGLLADYASVVGLAYEAQLSLSSTDPQQSGETDRAELSHKGSERAKLQVAKLVRILHWKLVAILLIMI